MWLDIIAFETEDCRVTIIDARTSLLKGTRGNLFGHDFGIWTHTLITSIFTRRKMDWKCSEPIGNGQDFNDLYGWAGFRQLQ
jgi:hypothetical protein